MRELLAGTGFAVFSMKERGLLLDIEETGETFEENAYIKAKAVWDLTGGIAIADDSGMCVDALDGRPGVYSARFLGEETPFAEKNRKIIEMLEEVPEDKRGASFVCAMVAILPDGSRIDTRGEVRGKIALEMSGEGGFGYDPIFFHEGKGRTFAELAEEEKNEISHRGIAVREMVLKLKEWAG